MKYIYRWAADGKNISLNFESSFFGSLDEAQKLELISLFGVPGIKVRKVKNSNDMILAHGGRLLCEAARRKGEQWRLVRWASADPTACLPGPGWGTGQNSPVVRSPLLQEDSRIQTEPVTREEILPASKGDRLVEISNQLDGRITSFGRKFWDFLDKELDPSWQVSRNGVKKIIYSDRYICSPFSAALLFRIIAELNERASVKRIEINTARLNERNQRRPYALYHNWQRTRQMEYVLRMLIMHLKAQPAIKIADKRDLPHARSLRLEYENGKRLTLFFDQGLGFWQAAGGMDDFPFEADEKTQAIHIQELTGRICGSQKHPTYIVIRKEEE